ncbi:MAG TPA: cob(I)yrinic acid a,c-diamide adenosyltransferase [Candidatus Limnocylindrales bacterium]|nr:cob(I)yrinic acid a,c-diamide adenosyltransferase [Candidatus Limnocylindrales bacterium]
MTAKPLPFESAVATGKGDDGSTGLLFGGDRVTKDDPRVEAYGTVDEAVAALGVARAQLGLKRQYGVLSLSFGGWSELLVRLQRELFVVGAELATNPDARDRARDGETRVTADMVDALGTVLREVESRIDIPREFIVPGQTALSAHVELARTTVRRAERRVTALARDGLLPPESHVLPYLNRLADLLWILARAAEAAESRTPIRATTRPRAARRSGDGDGSTPKATG